MNILLRGLKFQIQFRRGAVFKSKIRDVTKAPTILASPVTKKLGPPGTRVFSTDSTSNLLAALRKEFQEESGQSEMTEDLMALKNNIEENWRIVEEGATTHLYSKSQKVQVSFHCQDSVEELEANEEEYENEEVEVSAPIHFQVTLNKVGKCLVLECLSDCGEARVVGVRTTAEDVEESQLYQGPDFVELDETLQESFLCFLREELAVDDEVASFIAMYSDYREQMQYVQFLKDVQSIID